MEKPVRKITLSLSGLRYAPLKLVSIKVEVELGVVVN
jgi:hypothetical protein